MNRLDTFSFVETNVEDGDLSPLLELPMLRDVGTMDKKHSNYKFEQLNELLAERESIARDRGYSSGIKTTGSRFALVARTTSSSQPDSVDHVAALRRIYRIMPPAGRLPITPHSPWRLRVATCRFPETYAGWDVRRRRALCRRQRDK